jgi:hypothetical protein
MIPGIESTPPEMAWLLGFFMALALRRGRINSIIERFLPSPTKED